MNRGEDIAGLLAEWSEITTAESQAITANDWHALAGHQSRKAMLAERITGAMACRQSEALPASWRTAAAGLVKLENDNRLELEAKCREKREEIQKSNCTCRDLLGVRRAYGGLAASQWHSYS